MKKNKLLSLALMGITAGLSVNAQAAEEAQVIEVDYRQQTDCSKLSPDEQTLAQKLDDYHRKMFCNKFTKDQRRSVMQATCNGASNCGTARNGGKNIMTPQDAVNMVMRSNRLSMDEKREGAAESKVENKKS